MRYEPNEADRFEVAMRVFVSKIDANLDEGEWLNSEELKDVAKASVEAADALLTALTAKVAS